MFIWGPLPKLLKEIQSMKNSGYHGNQMKIVNNFFKMHLLLNYWTKFDKTLQVWSIWGAPSKLLKKIQSIENSGYHGNQMKIVNNLLKMHLLLNHWVNFDKILIGMFHMRCSFKIAKRIPIYWELWLPWQPIGNSSKYISS